LQSIEEAKFTYLETTSGAMAITAQHQHSHGPKLNYQAFTDIENIPDEQVESFNQPRKKI